jgi:hypothetical protein
MLFSLALRRAGKQGFTLAIHAVALGIAVFVLGMASAALKVSGEPLVLGAACPDGARRLQPGLDAALPSVRYALREATTFDVATLRTITRDAPLTAQRLEATLYDPKLFEAMCFQVDEGRAPADGAEHPEAFAHAGYPWAELHLGKTAQLGHARLDVVGTGEAFFGLGRGLAPAVWIPEAYADLLAARPDEGDTALWLIPIPPNDWRAVQRELAKIADSHADVLGVDSPILLSADGRTEEQMVKARRGVALLVLLSTAIALTVSINLLTYFAGQQPAFTGTAGVLHMLGATRRQQFLVGLSEPLVIALGALAVAALCHSMIASHVRNVLGDDRMFASAMPAYLFASMTAATALAWSRVRHVAAAGRSGVVAARRWSSRLYPWLLGIQVLLAVTVLALAVVTVLQWNAVRPGQYATNLEQLWHVRFRVSTPDAGLQSRLDAARLDATTNGELEIAFATGDAPLVHMSPTARLNAPADAQPHPDDLSATLVYASSNWLSILGLEARPLQGREAAVGADAAVVNVRFMTARWPDQEADFPYVTIEPIKSAKPADSASEPDALNRAEVFPIGGVYSDKEEASRDGDDLVQPTVVMPISRIPLARSTIALRALVRTHIPRNAAWIREQLQRVETLTRLQVDQVATARAVAENAVEGERQRAKVLMQLAIGTLIVALSGMLALCAAMATAMRRELATRFAIGWSRAALTRMMAMRLLRPAALGVGVGALFAFGATSMMAAQSPGLRPFVVAAVALAVVIVLVGAMMAIVRPIREVRAAVFPEWIREE